EVLLSGERQMTIPGRIWDGNDQSGTETPHSGTNMGQESPKWDETPLFRDGSGTKTHFSETNSGREGVIRGRLSRKSRFGLRLGQKTSQQRDHRACKTPGSPSEQDAQRDTPYDHQDVVS